MADYTVLYDAEQTEVFDQEVKPLLEGQACAFVAYSEEALIDLSPDTQRVLTWLGDEALYRVLPHASQQQWQVGLIPHPQMNRAYRTFFIPKKAEEAVADILQVASAVKADLMYCNDDLVLGSVMMGNPATMKPASQLDTGWWSKLTHMAVLIFNLRNASLLPYKLETAKQTAVNTAALGITLVYRPSGSDFTKRVVGETEYDEASTNAVILAPRSISEVVHFLLTRVFPKKPASGSLGTYLGHIKSECVTVSCPAKKIDYSVDGHYYTAERVEVKVDDGALQVLSSYLPKKLAVKEGKEGATAKEARETKETKETKESVRIAGLPKGQVVNELVSRPLPWIHHADQEELKETFMTLRENARTSEAYLVLMVLATLLATFGLFANSAPVIIGAMILAPLMAPIISLSMGVLRQNGDLITASAKTLFTGVLLALFFGTLLTLLTPLHTVNHEIAARLSPTILDLGVAIISGIAGAYASARSEVARSLAGVAIAVALVPPLAVSSIGIGWLDWDVFWGAFLLFLANLVGMVLAASATFLFMGYSPFHLAKKGMLLTLAFVGVVSIPLVMAFSKMVEEQSVIYKLEGWQTEVAVVRDVKVRSRDPMYVSATLLADTPLKGEQVDDIKQQMELLLGREIRLEATTAVIR